MGNVPLAKSHVVHVPLKRRQRNLALGPDARPSTNNKAIRHATQTLQQKGVGWYTPTMRGSKIGNR
jgi:hypothetical protein